MSLAVSIIDYGMGNIGSLMNMIQRVGGSSAAISDPDEIKRSEKLLLPGVGHFGNAVRKLRASGLFDAVDERVRRDGTPILCICLGAQLTMEGSEEGAGEGFAWFPGIVRRFPAPQQTGLRIPHMGWNGVRWKDRSTLAAGLEDEAEFYFVHSYYMEPKDEEDIYARTPYGFDFASALRRDGIYALQFHPEKSSRHGMTVVKNFLERV